MKFEQMQQRTYKRLQKEQEIAVAHSWGLRHQLHHGLELLTEDHELCQWDGELLPLEPMDKGYMMERDVVHGTTGGYQYHRRKGQNPCDECRAAQTEYNREARRRRNARKGGSEPT